MTKTNHDELSAPLRAALSINDTTPDQFLDMLAPEFVDFVERIKSRLNSEESRALINWKMHAMSNEQFKNFSDSDAPTALPSDFDDEDFAEDDEVEIFIPDDDS